MKKRLIFVARWEIIEPLGVLYLMGVAKALGWDVIPVLIKKFNFAPLYRELDYGNVDLVCFSIWTGFHLPALEAALRVRQWGVPVAIGGPHATFSTEQCLPCADWVIKGDGFRLFKKLLAGELAKGVVHFDPQRDDPFPQPARDDLYLRYPELGENPIKSLICSTGCPFTCSYCYAPHRNDMIKEATGGPGFRLELRDISEIIAEAQHVRDHYPVKMFYMQDDIFGFRLDWLAEFAERWPKEVGIPWHCQIRLEMTREEKRLDLFKQGGCSGITVAIESGNEFLRRHVLFRHMPDDLIVEGIRRIQKRGLTVRTEQILQVPFSDLDTDLQTLELNIRLNPSLAWASILAPYGGTNIGTVAKNFGFFNLTNDDLQDAFFERSVLRHTTTGARELLEPIVNEAVREAKDHPLLRMVTRQENGHGVAAFPDFVKLGAPALEHHYTFLSPEENERYCDQGVMLQRLFNWAAKVPQGERLVGRFLLNLAKEDWTWAKLSEYTEQHLYKLGFSINDHDEWCDRLNKAYKNPSKAVSANPYYFIFLPSGPQFAQHLDKLGFANMTEPEQQFELVGRETRRWLYDRALYKVVDAEPSIFSATESLAEQL